MTIGIEMEDDPRHNGEGCFIDGDWFELGGSMLVLSRKPGERIVLTGGIVITALGMRGGQMRIGIEAPPEVVVDRIEVSEAKKDERRFLE
jgi:carbon storage regulator